MAGKNIVVRIALDGAEAIQKKLVEIGTAISETVSAFKDGIPNNAFDPVTASAERAKKAVEETGEAARKAGDQVKSIGAGAETSTAVSGIDRLRNALEGAGVTSDRIKDAFNGLFQSMGQGGRIVQTVSGALTRTGNVVAGVTVAVGALVAVMGTGLVSAASKAANEIEKGANAANMTAQAYQRLQNITQALGGSNSEGLAKGITDLGKSAKDFVDNISKADGPIDRVTRSFGSLNEQVEFAKRNLENSTARLQGNWVQAGKEMSTAAQAAKALGIELFTVGKRGEILPKDSLALAEEVVRILSRLPDTAARSRAAILLLGKDWETLLKTADPKKFEAIWKSMNPPARPMSNDQLAALKEYDLALTRMQASMSAAANKLGAAFAPAFTALFNSMARAADGVVKFFDNISNRTSGTAGGTLANFFSSIGKLLTGDFAGALKDAGKAFQDFWALIARNPAGAIGTWAVIGTTFLGVAKVVGVVIGVFGKLFGLMGTAGGAVGKVSGAVTGLTGHLSRLAGMLASSAGAQFFLRMAAAAGGAVAAVLLVMTHLERIKSFLGGIGDALAMAFNGDFSGAASKISAEFSRAWADIKAGGTGLWTQIALTALAVIPTIRVAFQALGAPLWTAIRAAAVAIWPAISTAAGFAARAIVMAFTGLPGLIGIAIATAALLIYKHWDEIKAYGEKAWTELQKIFSGDFSSLKPLGDWFKGLWDSVISGGKSAWDTAMNYIKQKGQEGIDYVKKLWTDLKDWASKLFTGKEGQPQQAEAMKPKVEADTGAAKAAGQKVGEAFKQGFDEKAKTVGADLGTALSKAGTDMAAKAGAATAGLDKVAEASKRVTETNQQAAQSSSSLGSTLASIGKSIADFLAPPASAGTLPQQTDKAREAVSQLGSEVQKVGPALATSFDKLSQSAGNVEVATSKVYKNVQPLAGSLDQVGSAASKAGTSVQPLVQGFGEAGEAVTKFATAATSVAGTIADVASKSNAAVPGFQSISGATDGVVRGFTAISGTQASSKFSEIAGSAAQVAGRINEVGAAANQFGTNVGVMITQIDSVTGKLQQFFLVPPNAQQLNQTVAQIGTGMQTLATQTQTLGPAVAQSFTQISTGAQTAAQAVSQVGTQITTSLQNVNASLSTTVQWSLLTDGLNSLDLATPFQTKVTALGQTLSSFDWSPMVNTLTQAFEKIAPAVTQIFQTITQVVTQAVEKMTNSVKVGADQMVEAFRRVEQAAKAAAAAAAQAAAAGSSAGDSGGGQGFARGGHVRGKGTGTSDSIAAWLSNGEFVMRAAAVRKLGVGFLNALNSGRMNLRGFADGGLVDGIGSGLSAVMSPMVSLAAPSAIPEMAVAGGGLSGRPIEINMDGQSFQAVTAEDTARNMEKVATRSKLRQAYRKPTWFS